MSNGKACVFLDLVTNMFSLLLNPENPSPMSSLSNRQRPKCLQMESRNPEVENCANPPATFPLQGCKLQTGLEHAVFSKRESDQISSLLCEENSGAPLMVDIGNGRDNVRQDAYTGGPPLKKLVPLTLGC